MQNLGYGFFELNIPTDTFWDPVDGFGTSMTVLSPLPAWVAYDATTRTFYGLPTLANEGTFGIWLVARNRFNLTSPVLSVAAVVRRDFRLTPVLLLNFSFVLFQPQLRRATSPCTMTPAERTDLVRGLATEFQTTTDNINILSIDALPDCTFNVSFSLNSVVNCSQTPNATNFVRQVTRSSLQQTLNKFETQIVVTEPGVTATTPTCVAPPVLPPAEGNSISTRARAAPFVGSVLPVILIALLLLILGIILLVLLRRKRNEKALHAKTFANTTPTLLPNEQFEFPTDGVEKEPRNLFRSSRDPDEDEPAAPPSYNSSLLGGRGDPPAYRNPPPYPLEGRVFSNTFFGLDIPKDDPDAFGEHLPEVMTVKTVAMSSTFAAPNAPAPPPYFRPAAFATLSALTAVSRPDEKEDSEEPEAFRLPSFNPPWLDKEVYSLDDSLADEYDNELADPDGVDLDVDPATLQELEILRHHLHDTSSHVQWKKDQ